MPSENGPKFLKVNNIISDNNKILIILLKLSHCDYCSHYDAFEIVNDGLNEWICRSLNDLNLDSIIISHKVIAFHGNTYIPKHGYKNK